MMSRNFFHTTVLAAALLAAGTSAGAQKRVSELTITYNYIVSTGVVAQPQVAANLSYFIKGSLSRAEMTSQAFSSTTIYDAKAGSGVILKEVNGQKLLIRMNTANWLEKNSRLAGTTFTKTGEKRNIAGYDCSNATATTKDGFDIKVWFTRDILSENKTYDETFHNLDGLPLEYEISKGNIHIKYSLTSINLNPVPAGKFDIPTAGYREMTYDESRKN